MFGLNLSGVIDRDDRDNIFVREERTFFNEPIKRTIWWRVVATNAYAGPIRGEVYYLRGGVWRGGGFEVRTYDGNDVESSAARYEDHPIPPPKTKFQVRYHNGRWQKLLKRGWVDV